ncbi:MAG: KH domain-containing protein [Anaerolineae bacterium]|nr:MAG: KH domain-containing protein [Anaerolineae bacterium]
MKELVEYMAKNLVDDPSQVHVRESVTPQEIRVDLHVAPDDMGRIIGKNGRVVNSLRVLLRVSAVRQGKRASLEIN